MTNSPIPRVAPVAAVTSTPEDLLLFQDAGLAPAPGNASEDRYTRLACSTCDDVYIGDPESSDSCPECMQAVAPVAPDLAGEREAFEAWWRAEGADLLDGGGTEEKIFAYRGYVLGLASRPQVSGPAPAVSLTDEQIIEEAGGYAMAFSEGGGETQYEFSRAQLLAFARDLIAMAKGNAL